LLPLTYVDNCADAVVQAALHAPSGSVFPVVDDELPTCRAYLKGHCQQVERMRCIPVSRWAFRLGSKVLVWYHRKSKGQLPAIFTPYVVNSMYRPLRYSNAALVAIGWTRRVSTSDEMQCAFDYVKGQLKKLASRCPVTAAGYRGACRALQGWRLISRCASTWRSFRLSSDSSPRFWCNARDRFIDKNY
jgi:hypothetical protein